ncbi:hypothetical protein EV401DRAFT_887853 [Pisolithus croceorrhizus]|nr:hypothetical protein EV401DRAFT_887853 [Pisolithus croceorrhizus]
MPPPTYSVFTSSPRHLHPHSLLLLYFRAIKSNRITEGCPSRDPRAIRGRSTHEIEWWNLGLARNIALRMCHGNDAVVLRKKATSHWLPTAARFNHTLRSSHYETDNLLLPCNGLGWRCPTYAPAPRPTSDHSGVVLWMSRLSTSNVHKNLRERVANMLCCRPSTPLPAPAERAPFVPRSLCIPSPPRNSTQFCTWIGGNPYSSDRSDSGSCR